MNKMISLLFIHLFFVLASVTIIDRVCAQAAAPESDQVEKADTESKTIFLDAKTIKKGITLSFQKGDFILAIPPSALSAPATIYFTPQESVDETLPKNTAIYSSQYQVSILEEEVKILKPLRLIFSIEDFEFLSSVYQWDASRQKWTILEKGGCNWGAEEVWAETSNLNKRFIVLKDLNKHLIGRATWYPDKLSPDSVLSVASNEYPLGTKLKITNLETKESVLVTVRSKGPYYKGRIIDLTKTAFSRIGFPRKQGILTVAVEEIKVKNSSKTIVKNVPKK